MVGKNTRSKLCPKWKPNIQVSRPVGRVTRPKLWLTWLPKAKVWTLLIYSHSAALSAKSSACQVSSYCKIARGFAAFPCEIIAKACQDNARISISAGMWSKLQTNGYPWKQKLRYWERSQLQFIGKFAVHPAPRPQAATRPPVICFAHPLAKSLHRTLKITAHWAAVSLRRWERGPWTNSFFAISPALLLVERSTASESAPKGSDHCSMHGLNVTGFRSSLKEQWHGQPSTPLSLSRFLFLSVSPSFHSFSLSFPSLSPFFSLSHTHSQVVSNTYVKIKEQHQKKRTHIKLKDRQTKQERQRRWWWWRIDE